MLNIKEIGLCGGVWLAGACVFSFVAKGAEWIVKEKDESLGRTRRKQLFRRAAVSGGGGVTALLCMEKKETLPASVTLFLFFAVLAGAALVDQDTLEIPDGFHGAIGLLGFVSIFTMPGVPVWERLAGSLCVSLPLFLLTAVIPGAFGGGDIKLTAACGFFLGWKSCAWGGIFAILFAGAWGAFLLASKRAGRKDHFAFGPFLVAGMAAAVFWGRRLWLIYWGFLTGR